MKLQMTSAQTSLGKEALEFSMLMLFSMAVVKSTDKRDTAQIIKFIPEVNN